MKTIAILGQSFAKSVLDIVVEKVNLIFILLQVELWIYLNKLKNLK